MKASVGTAKKNISWLLAHWICNFFFERKISFRHKLPQDFFSFWWIQNMFFGNAWALSVVHTGFSFSANVWHSPPTPHPPTLYALPISPMFKQRQNSWKVTSTSLYQMPDVKKKKNTVSNCIQSDSGSFSDSSSHQFESGCRCEPASKAAHLRPCDGSLSRG